ncbi:MAG: hypothetical protein ABEH38_05020 [Flavobacteriales bacterium]
MRLGISIGLLFLLVFQTVLLLPLTQLTLEMHQKKVKAYLNTKEGEKSSIKLSLTPKELRQLEWEDAGEFVHKGWMYDLVEMEKKNGRYVLTVYKDERETRMKERQKALRKGPPQSGEKNTEEGPPSIQPFKYFKGRSAGIHPPMDFRLIGRLWILSTPEEVLFKVPLPPPC